MLLLDRKDTAGFVFDNLRQKPLVSYSTKGETLPMDDILLTIVNGLLESAIKVYRVTYSHHFKWGLLASLTIALTI